MSSSNEQAPTTTHNVVMTAEQYQLTLTEARRDNAQKQYEHWKARRKVAKLQRRAAKRRAANTPAPDPLSGGIMGTCEDPKALGHAVAELMAQPGVEGVCFQVEPVKKETEVETRV
ncbi:hypothetical protein ACHAPM_009754 [Fusarium culmorum]